MPYTTVGEAFESAQKDADSEDIVLVTGSVFVVAEI
jgi:folylpolyglutamate synthase/dihydropteroate synthase